MAKRAATASKRRGRGPVRATPSELKLISDHRKQLAIARSCYEKADRLLAELINKLGIGKRKAIGGGLFAEVVDPFEVNGDGKIVWKHVAVRRHELRITDEDGKEARLRNRPANGRRKPAGAKQKQLF